MLNIFHSTGLESPHPQRIFSGLSLGLISCVVLAFNAAGAIHTGLIGLLGLIFLFLLLGLAGCYWYAASVYLLAQWMAVNQTSLRPVSRSLLVSLQGFWPMMLLGPAVSAQRIWPEFGLLFTLAVLAGTGATLILGIRRAYSIDWPQASFCFGATIVLGGFAMLGLLGWPAMLLLGANHFGPALMIPLGTSLFR